MRKKNGTGTRSNFSRGILETSSLFSADCATNERHFFVLLLFILLFKHRVLTPTNV